MKNIVFLIGSGFSKDLANFPTLTELSLEVNKYLEPPNPQVIDLPNSTEWRETLLRLYKASGVPHSITQNIEELLSFLYQDYPWRSEEESHLAKASYYQVVRGIENVLVSHEETNFQMAASHPTFKKLIDYWHANGSTVISFNYDTVIEKAVEHFGVKDQGKQKIPLGDIYQIPITHLVSRSHIILWNPPKNSLKLLKLHGSVNWFYSGCAEFSGEQIFYYPTYFATKEDEEIARKNKKGLVPLIIPPLLDKGSFYFNSGIKLQWQLAKAALEKADVICAVGYSLPATDLVTSFLLRDALSKRKSKIIVINKTKDSEREATLERYKSIIQGDMTRIDFPDVGEDSSVVYLAEKVLSL